MDSNHGVAFGFRIDGLRAHALLRVRRPEWPALHVRRQIGPAPDEPGQVGEAGARLSFGGGDWLELDRTAATATYRTAAAVDEDTLIHPLLAPAAGLMARWLGREAFHAGALLGEDGAWALAGTNQAGKSTLLAALAMRGGEILTDDLLVLEPAGITYAGPRCIDLRAPDLVGAGVQARVRPVRGGTRQRLDLPAVVAAAPLRGWLFLEWGDRVEAESCPAAARIERLMAQRRWATQPMDSRTLLDLAALPAWILRRPRGAQHIGAVLELLARLVGERLGAAAHHDACAASPPAAA